MGTPPDLIELHAGHDSVVLDPAAGGRVRSLVAGGRERLRPPPPHLSPDDAMRWGSFLMAPWVGRLRDGRLPFEGRVHRFEPNLGGHAIHGLCFTAPWAVERSSDREAVLSFDLAATAWPFGGRIGQVVELTPGVLRMRAEIAATGEAMPAAVGWHPWFRKPEGEEVWLQVPADRVLLAEDELLPTGEIAPVEGRTDLRTGRVVRMLMLDDAFVDVRRATLRWSDLELEIQGGRTINSMVVYVADDAVCVEPQTAWPDAPTLAAAGHPDTGLVTLRQGESLVAEQTWTWGEVA
jgi:aldose 1-epimerase